MQSHDDFVQEYLIQIQLEEKDTLSKNSSIIAKFKQYCRMKGVILQDEDFHYAPTTGIIAQYPGLLSFIFPELEIDKEGLTNLDELMLSPRINSSFIGTVHMGDFIIFASSYFRRGYQEKNNYTPDFITRFWCSRNKSFNRRILLDMNRVRIDVNGSEYFERDTWYGAKYDKNLSNITDGNVKLRPPGHISESHTSIFFGDTYSMDIKWDTKNKIKTFQLEEFKTSKIILSMANKPVHPVRYIHAEYNLEKCEFRHFDGAIHFYTEEEYYARRDSDFNFNAKNPNQIKTNSIKLFKINGKIPVEIWVELTSHFLHGNPLIFEYYEGKYPKYILEFLTRLDNLAAFE